MSSNISVDEFHVTKVVKPSPIKKSTLLRNTKKRKEKFKNLEEVVSRMEKTEKELISYIEKKFTSDLVDESPSLQNETNFDESEKNIFLPRGRPFFIDAKDDLTPSLWFPKNSMFHCQNLKDFKHLVKMGVLQTKFMKDDKETMTLRRYCLCLLNLENDDLFCSFLLDFLSSCHIPYEMVSLKERGSKHFERFLEILQKHVAEYKPEEARALFRDAFLSSLDPKTISSRSSFPAFLFSCLQVSTSKYPVEKEINWIIQQRLTPEEFSYILSVLPQISPYETMSLKVGMGALMQIFNAETIPFEFVTLESLVSFLKKHTSSISTLSENTVYHIMNILIFMFHNFSSHEEDSLEEFNSIVSGFKRHFKMGKSISYFSLNEVTTRLLLSIQVRMPNDVRRSLQLLSS